MFFQSWIKKWVSVCGIAAAVSYTWQADAQIPAQYYLSIDGKTGAALKTELYEIISPHTQISYSDLWSAYEITDVVPGTEDQIFDMFSPTVHYYSSRGNAVNREHVCPQSWWGGGNRIACYSDLFNVYPSESKANSAKGNYPLGEVTGSVNYENGRITVGRAAESGGAPYVFEPCDEFKGDFARIYFYVATCYQHTAWEYDYAFVKGGSTYPTLKSWLIPLLLEWNAADPVSDWEIARQEKVFALQHNRNPFIDYPVLADYIWGDKNGVALDLGSIEPNTGGGGTVTPRCTAPRFTPTGGGTPATALKVVSGTDVALSAVTKGSTLYYRFDYAGTWDSICAAAVDVAPEITFNLEESACIEAWVRRDGFISSDTVTACYAVVETGEYLLYEEFVDVETGDHFTTSGSSAAWGGNENFPVVSAVYSAGGAIRMGSSKKAGSITSRTLFAGGGCITVEVDVKGWTGIEGTLMISVTGAAARSVAYSATMSDDFETCTAVFTGCSANPTVTISTSGKRAFLKGVRVRATDESSIENVGGDRETASDVIYDVTGRRLEVLPSQGGIYFVNGKKIIRK